MTLRTLCCCSLVLCLCLSGMAVSALDLPGAARLERETVAAQDGYAVPIAPFVGEAVPTLQMQGGVRRQAWRIPGNSLTPFQIVKDLQDQLLGDGYALAFSCDAATCGGFDFRFGIDVFPAPYMFVNLRGFHFATLLRGPEGAPDGAITLLSSTAQGQGYLQVVEVTSAREFLPQTAPKTPDPVPSTPAAQPAPQAQLTGDVDDLLARGSVVLEGLTFATGATTLGEGPFPILKDLGDFLLANPRLRVALVGHTDSIGSLDGNIRISKQRAGSVRARLIERYGVPPAQLDSEGMGYLAPRASNLTVSGRETNRRVEAIILTDE